MIQELFGGGGESAPKFALLSSSPTCPSTTPNILTAPITSTRATPLSTSISPSTSSKGTDGNNNSEKKSDSSQNLRCPRCDSTNTKFCYYNNYNLTQPRHFCKTCRRYWTKGGTLRNVPIGGGCRKNKATSTNSPSAVAKAKATLSTQILLNGINSGFLRNGSLDPLQPGPIPTLWPSSSHPHGQVTSRILPLLQGSSHFPKHNPNPSLSSSVFTALKTEGRNLGSDPYSNRAPVPFLLGSSLRSGFGLGGPDVIENGAGSSSNILELYQKWKSSGNYNNHYCGSGEVATLGNAIGSSTSSSSPLNSTGLAAISIGGGGESNQGGYGIMNPSFSSCWSEFPTVPINGTFP